MAITNKTPVYITDGIAPHFIDTEENWINNNPITIPGMLYISSGSENSSFKIGDGRRWNLIKPFNTKTSGVPIGTIIFCLTKIAPEGYLPLNGALLNRVEYSDLFMFASNSNLIVTDYQWLNDITYRGMFSYGNENTTFRLPLIDDITIEGWSTDTGNNPGRDAGTYQRGTIIGTDYFFGSNQSTPYMTFFNYGLSIKNGMTTDQCPSDITINNENSNIYEYAANVASALTDRQNELVHPDDTDLLDAISLDTPNFKNNYNFNSPKTGNIFPVNSYSSKSIVGMTRCESIAYPVYIKYTNF